MMIPILFFTPVTLALISLLFRRDRLDHWLVLIHAIVFFVCVGGLFHQDEAWLGYFASDAPAVLVLGLIAVIYFAVAVKRCLDSRLASDDLKTSRGWHSLQTVSLMIFIGAMAATALSTHAAMLWVFVEATTLASAPLIYSSRTKSALEATWKYIFICSIGIALAFIGVIILMIGMEPGASLYFKDLERDVALISPFWLKFSFPFILIGFGTKAGFAPVHAWLPDAHSEAPSYISALLSATLLNTALLAILRFGKVLDSAGFGSMVSDALIITGFLSLFVSAIYLFRVKDFKRMLAYSSIENMGIMAIGFGLGGLGALAATLHMVIHSLAKGALFLTAGDILHLWKRRDFAGVRGVLTTKPSTGWIWLLGFVAISGVPPFAAFFSELMLISALLTQNHPLLLAGFLLLLILIIWGMGRGVLKVALGPVNSKISGLKQASILPQVILLLLAVLIVVALPPSVEELFKKVALEMGIGGGVP